MTARRFLFPIAVLFLTFWISEGFGKDLYRVVYSNDPILRHEVRTQVGRQPVGQAKERRRRWTSEKDPEQDYGLGQSAAIEEAYSARYFVIPEIGDSPKMPKKVDGILIHTDAETDGTWVQAAEKDDNPALKFEPIAKDLGEKWAEYSFIQEHAPNLVPPLTKLGSDLVKSGLTRSDRSLRSPDSFETLSKAEQGRLLDRIEKALDSLTPEAWVRIASEIRVGLGGDGFVKLRSGFHSEGNVPKTHKPWGPIWEGYLKDTRPKIKARLRELGLPPLGIQNAALDIQNEIWDWPYIEGTVLEELLLDPEQIVVQKKIRIGKEVRIHVVEHQILEGATFLRMYEPLGRYLTIGETRAFEEILKTEFLDKLPEKFRPFSCSPDLVWDEGEKRYRILDLNPGYYSGYFFPEEDLFTTHRLAKFFTGEASRFLRQFDDFARERVDSDRKPVVLKALREDWKGFVYGTGDGAYDHESFWDRVIRHYVDESLSKQGNGKDFDLVLQHLASAGLRSVSIYYQFINEVQSELKLRLTPERLQFWVTQLKAFNQKEQTDYVISSDEGRLVVSEPEEKRARKAA